jgi:subtilisin family serine protease
LNRQRFLSAGLVLFLFLGIAPQFAQSKDKERFSAAYAKGQSQFYQDLIDFSQDLILTPEDTEKLKSPEQEIPGLYQHLMNFYYILHPLDDRSEVSIDSHFQRISRRMAKELIFSIPGTSSMPDVSPLTSTLISAGYYAKKTIPHFRRKTRPMRSYVKNQWALEDLKVADAHSMSRGKGIRLAIIDTGIDPTLQPLRAKTKKSKNFLDGSKLPGERGRYPYDWCGHGTSLATVIHEIAPDVELMIVKFFESESMGPAPSSRWTCYLIAAGMMWAAQNGADIINLSVSLNQDIAAIWEAARYCWDNNVVVITSMGNAFGDMPRDSVSYLAAYPWTIADGGMEKMDGGFRVWEHSGIGGYIDVVAPAKDLYVEVPLYRGRAQVSPLRWGNSLATSFVAGTTALILSSLPEQTLNRLRDKPGQVPETVRYILRETASNEILGYTSPNPYSGHGMIEILGAVQKAKATTISAKRRSSSLRTESLIK